MGQVGSGGVANQANTTPGSALGVVGNAYNGYGNDVGDHGVVDIYGPPSPPGANYYILMESSGYVLLEDGSKIILE